VPAQQLQTPAGSRADAPARHGGRIQPLLAHSESY